METMTYINAREDLRGLIGRDGVAAFEAAGIYASKKRMTEIAREHRQGCSIKRAAEAMQAYVPVMRLWERELSDRRYAKALARPDAPDGVGARGVLRTPEQRREEIRAAQQHDIVRELRVAERANVCVVWVESIQDCGVTVERHLDWNGYARSCKYPMASYAVTCRAVRYPVCRMALPRKVDGMLLLVFATVDVPANGCDALYRARLLRKTRGVAWDVVDGYVAVLGRSVVYSDTPEKAVRKLRRIATAAWRRAVV